LYAVTFLAGSYLPDLINGLIVIAMVSVMAIGKLGGAPHESTSRAEREQSAARWETGCSFPR
jgi:uncharacterized membrane protein